MRAYLLVVGAGLLAEGGALLLASTLGVPVPYVLDTPHNLLHVVWGVLILGILTTARDPRRVSALASLFGVFYTGLAIAGVVFANPFGLLLGTGENIFHFVVGLSSLGAGTLMQLRWGTVVAVPDASGH
ncbi:MAG: hypothetical protein JOZ65_17045 [Chloroflexi bacterium]|nr:hypothetical protein [Chloroflexota bacterium]